MIPADKLTDAQKKAVAEMQGGSFAVGGPFLALLREPKLAEQAVAMATYFRSDSVLGTKLTEFEILLAARDWTQQFEWTAHYSRALKAGVKQETINAIADGRRPAGMPEDEEIVYDFWTELDRNKSVSDATYDRAVKKFGERGVVSYDRAQWLLCDARDGAERGAHAGTSSQRTGSSASGAAEIGAAETGYVLS